MKKYFLFVPVLLISMLFSSCEEMSMKTLHCTSVIVILNESSEYNEYFLSIKSDALLYHSSELIANQNHKESTFSDSIEHYVGKEDNFLFFPFQVKRTIDNLENIEINISLIRKTGISENRYESRLIIPKLKSLPDGELNCIDFLLRNNLDDNDVLNAFLTYDLWLSI